MAEYPEWVKKARVKIDVDRICTRKELATKLNINYAELCHILSGHRQNEKNHIRRICDYLDIEQ